MPRQTVLDRIAEGNLYVSEHMYAFEDAHVRREYEAYRRALDEIFAGLNDLWRMNIDGPNWDTSPLAIEVRNALIRQMMAIMGARAAQELLDSMMLAHDAGLYGTAWMLDNSLRAEGISPIAIPQIPTEAVRAQLLAPYVGQTFLGQFQDKRVEFEGRIRRALTQSQIQGDGIYQVQKRIAEELGIDISRRTKADRKAHRRDFYRTQMIARTEILRASNLGSMAVFEANRDILNGWEWLATEDERTCPICGELDGKVFSFDDRKQPPPPAHVQCRCTTLPVLIDKDLQDRIAPPRQTFMDWAAAQGLDKNRYGQVFSLPRREAPKLEKAS